MAYLALYREWRPHNFKDMVGQEHITKTLINALRQNKVAHAYLFSGPRGTGKTTTAKILAKALNCENREGIEPCNQCYSCTSIDQGTALEVLEIDAASNRGIDEIRDLREKIKLSAPEGKFKVYIIDEVHMLTTEAFNALLKTLEEPPKQVVFILATTEAHKIPLTILSRVQRFEFHRISLEQLQARLTEVCQALNRPFDPEALRVIAQKSEGGLRDALSILDQCLIMEGHLGVEQVYDILGLVGEVFSFELVEALDQENYGQILGLLNEGINKGRDPRQIVAELMEYLRQALLYLTTGQTPLVTANFLEKVQEQGKRVSLPRILRWIEILLQGEYQLKFASNARLAAELLLVQAIYESQTIGDSAASGDVLQRLRKLEQNFEQLQQKPLGSAQEPQEPQEPQQPKASPKSVINPGNVVPDKTPLPKRQDIAVVGKELTTGNIQARWQEVLEYVRKYKKSTHAFLIEANPSSLQGNILTLVFQEGFSFHRDKVDQNENRKTIEEALQQVFGTTLTIRNIMVTELNQQEPAQTQREHTIVKKAADMFGAELVVIKD